MIDEGLIEVGLWDSFIGEYCVHDVMQTTN